MLPGALVAVMRRELPKTGRAGLPPLRHDLVNIQRAEALRRSLHHSRVHLGDLAISTLSATIRCRTVASSWNFSRVASTSSLLHLAEQLERWRQHGDLLALNELLLPPERVVFLTEVREWLTCPWQVVESPLFDGGTNLSWSPEACAASWTCSFPVVGRGFAEHSPLLFPNHLVGGHPP